MTWSLRMRAALGLAALGLLTSCGGYGSICQAEMDCRGGNPNDVSACEEGYEAEEGVASAAHCDGQWSDYYACLQDHSTCRSGPKFDSGGFCDGPAAALSNCQASIRKF
jgi:hypothetical protein